MIAELSYSFHLGSDKNKKNTIRRSSKNNVSKSTSLSNNAIQNANQLSRVDKHNYRKYDNEQKLIQIVKGTSSLYDDVKNLYVREFDSARIEYNERQTRDDRKIDDYFSHISKNEKNDLACEIIIELGDKKYWDTKDIEFKKRMTNVYSKQVEDLENILPNFKIASAIIHYDETSPHLHIVGVPIKNKSKNGMSKQVGKTDVFTKDSLKILQDKMRILCIESFNQEYNQSNILKKKLKGRNKDIHVSDMTNYQALKDELNKNKEKLELANKKSLELKDNSKDIKDTINNLKQTKLNKDNYIISSEDKEKLIKYIEKVDITNDDYNKLQPLAITLNNANEQIKMLNDNNKALSLRNFELNKKVNEYENTINNLEEDNYSLRIKVTHLKKKFKKMLKFLHDKLFGWGKKDSIYNQVVNDFYNNDILDDTDINLIKKDNYEL
ncbi:MAG: plasmid recombination protein [Bacilli bacterium]|nr:plasmid recombination protein [Bacilli bacterium]